MIRRVIAGTACIVIAVLALTVAVQGYEEYADCLHHMFPAKCDAHPPAGPKCINPVDDNCGQTQCFFCVERTNPNNYRYCILVPYNSSCPAPHGTITCSNKKRNTYCQDFNTQCVCRNEGGEVVTETCVIKTCSK